MIAIVAQRETLAAWAARFGHERTRIRLGEIERVSIAGAALAPPNSVDLAILANNVHTMMAEGTFERRVRRRASVR
jgi:hypothetical protein